MPSVHEQLTEQFRKWEIRGRGWQVFEEPVYPEPPFRPFLGHYLHEQPAVDNGRRPTFLSSFVQRLSQRMGPEQPVPPVIVEPEEEPGPVPLNREPLAELQTSLPAKLDISLDAFAQFLRNLALCREPIAFELLGLPNRVITQFAAHKEDAPLVRRQLQAYFPEAVFQQHEGTLENAWLNSEGTDAWAIEFGLEREFMFPLSVGKIDPFIGIVGALSELKLGELGLFQVLFQPLSHSWAESITNSVTGPDGRPLFVNVPELSAAAEEKVARPLYATVVRIAVETESWERTLQLAQDLAGSLRVFSNPQSNALIPLSNTDYPPDDHIEDVLRRQSRRSGMVMNSEELTGFVHLPTSAVQSPVLERDTGRTKAAPTIVRQASGVLLGNNVHAGELIQVRLTSEQRVRHTHVIGASGTGKSTLLFNLIKADIENGDGIAVLDPHGDLVDRILGVIPPERIRDVVLVDPSDEQYSVGFNILSAHSDLEKNLLASDLVSVFQRLSTSWGDQMGSVLNNAILAFLESDRRGTLADLRRFLVEPPFRADFLKSVSDPALLYYWQKGFPQLSGNKSIGSVITRLETFLAPKPIRYMVSQPENRLDFGHIMDSGQIFLAKLSQGLLGNENSYLLGTLLVSKFQQLAMARQSKQQTQRRDFWVYVDEFHNFISPSMAEILAGARKYRIGLILAHQELRQLQRDSEVASAVMSNPYTRICFRVGDDDARRLADGFASFEARDLQNLGTGEAIARVERSAFDFNLAIPLPQEPNEAEARERREAVIRASIERYGTRREEIERALRLAWDSERVEPATAKPERKKQKLPPANLPEPPIEAVVPPAVEPPAIVPSPPPEPVGPAPLRELKEIPTSESKPRAPTQDLGRGGAQHKAVQRRLKAAAEKLGFRGDIEKEVLEGQGSIDLLLERGGQFVACEISVTTTIDHEVGNVAKCLKAGFSQVAVICLEEERLKKIAAAVAGSLGPEASARVLFALPDAFISRLKEMAPPTPTPAASQPPETRRGYKVKRSVSKLSQEEQKERGEAAIRSIAESMRKKS
jgi:hypothetical protein